MERKMPLKNKLARLFQVSTLLRSPCSNSSTTSSSTTIFSSSTPSSRMSPSPDIAVIDPVFLPRNNSFTHHRQSVDGTNPPFRHGKIDRSNSLPLKLGQLDCGSGGCRPIRTSSSSWDVNLGKKINIEKKLERRVRENGKTYETGEFEGSMCPPASPTSPKKCTQYTAMAMATTKKKKKTTKKLLSNGYGFSSSSSDDFFSSNEEEESRNEESENIFSSRSFSSDSSEFYQRPSSNYRKKKSNKKKPPTHRGVQSSGGFRPLVSLTAKEEGKEGKSGIPVRKRSNDPYVDFRDSMVEMIVERQIFGAKGLEKLLHSYLSLNAPHHHPVILRAFADISEVLFGN